jgi:ABC-type branched-subunit amino acid transport system substrate-binding protein
VRVGAVAIALAALAAGCGAAERQDHAPVTESPTTVGPVVTIRIGYLGDLGSGGTVVSKAVQDGERLAVQQYAGNSHDIDVVIETVSTGGTTAGAAAAARTLLSDHVAAVIGPQSVEEAEGSGPVLAHAGIPSLSPTVTATTLPSSSWSGFFRVVADDMQQGVAEANEIVDNLGRRQVAVASGTSTSDQARVSAAQAQIATDGGTVVATTGATATATGAGASSPQGTLVPATAANQIVASGADGVLVSAPGPVARTLVADLDTDGFKGSILLAVDATTSTGFLTPLGASADGAYVASPANDTSSQAANGGDSLEFRDTYRAAFGQVPPSWAAEAYDATNFVLAGISAGSTTAATLSSYLTKHSWTGIAETLDFTTGGVETHPRVWISQVQNGTLTQLGPAS